MVRYSRIHDVMFVRKKSNNVSCIFVFSFFDLVLQQCIHAFFVDEMLKFRCYIYRRKNFLQKDQIFNYK